MARTKFSDLPGSIDTLVNQLSASVSKENLDKIFLTLSLLSTRAGTLLLAGHATPFPDLTVEQREAVLQRWKASNLALLRSIYRGIVGAFRPLRALPGRDITDSVPAAAVAIFVVYNNYENVVLATGYPARGDLLRYADQARLRKHYEYTFERISTPFQEFETDMLVIGSGAGGGVVASQLAQQGWNVFVLDKGTYVKPEDMLGVESDGFNRLYENGGLMATEDGAMTILAGSTFGGGTTSTSASFDAKSCATP